MTELETLTYLTGSLDDKIKLLYTIADKDKLQEVLNLVTESEDSHNKKYARLYLILNPNVPEGIINSKEFKRFVQNLSDSESNMISSYLKDQTKHISNETFKLLIESLSESLTSKETEEDLNSSYYLPYYLKNKKVLNWTNLLTKLIQHKNLNPINLRPLESLLLQKNKSLSPLIPYILKVSNNEDFINHFLVKLSKDTNKTLNYTQHHLVANNHLSSEQILFLEKNFLLKPKQKKTLANHPNKKAI